ncbi:prepilin-type N-terminal cleavage/methylation domain-containing protein [Opitutaceae bacterium TAV1]|nr:prepilin-type N-terminal cleavage/methylation domain-containing protein [Opitutaceae bacterium TAV1]
MTTNIQRNATAPCGGFTLVELLTVIAIIGILVAILIPVAGRVRNSARRTEAASNVRQLVIGLQIYATDNKQMLPANVRPNGTQDETWRLRVLYDEGYVRDPKVFVNPFNAAGGRRGLGQNVCGPNRDCYFSAARVVYITWDGTRNVSTYLRVTEGTEIPVVWDQRADNENSTSNQMKTADGRFGGYFGYIDGKVKLIGKPDPVVRGQ